MKTITRIILITLLIGIAACNSNKKQESTKEEHAVTAKTEKKKKALTEYENLKFSAFYQDIKNEISDHRLISTNAPGKITEIILVDKTNGHYAVTLDTLFLIPDMPKMNQIWEFSQVANSTIKHVKYIEKKLE
ncbi:hypothetical protein MWU65_01050 [Cellulophaga sp. F20128]|uniref:hypothetical protein n=1 Tax=Cellulophaga sp. F20128 TaxID=2926413 RepID=UPI001FF29085|nr:hypothetical protein [Cellulophaga sp. F20128]MCK0155747.1 hypothetical protein [Cellulophaga sp. F20128]